VKFTAFFGPTDDIVLGQNLRTPQIIAPVQLPLQVSPLLKRSLVTVNVHSLNLENRQRRFRLIVRVLDTGSNTSVSCIENIMFMSYEDVIWCSPVSSGKRWADFTETFALDLSDLSIPLISLVLVVQVDRGSSDNHLNPYAYGLLQLGSEIGTITTKLDGEISLCEFKQAGKLIQPSDFPLTALWGGSKQRPCGTLNYHLIFASTMLTSDEYIFRMLNLKAYRQDTKKALENFMFCGISEWPKFAPELMLSHLRIISGKKTLEQVAFHSLASMFSELLSKAGGDYSQVLNEFIRSRFARGQGEVESDLVSLCDALLPYVIESLSGDILNQEYRTVIKTIPYLVRLIAHSFALEPSADKQASIRGLFDKLCEIVARVEEDKTEEFICHDESTIASSAHRVDCRRHDTNLQPE
jgi:hypothetical protein